MKYIRVFVVSEKEFFEAAKIWDGFLEISFISRAKLQVAVDAIPISTALIGPDQRITHVNGKIVAIIGAVHVGRHFILAIRQPDVITAKQVIYQVTADWPAAKMLINCADWRQVTTRCARFAARDTRWGE